MRSSRFFTSVTLLLLSTNALLAQETGRITGYPGEIWFWQELADILVKIGFHSESVTGN